MTRTLRNESGMALFIAIMVLLVMMALGLGTFWYVQGQQKASGEERVRDSSYYLADAALESGVAYLSVQWPTATSRYGWKVGQPNTSEGPCGPTSAITPTPGDNCPDPASVTSAFTQSGTHQVDYAGAPNWTTTVRDNGSPGPSFYRESSTGTQPEYDANGDGAVWLRAQATVQGKTRIVVALVKPEPKPLPIPASAATAYDIQITTTLNQKVIDTKGSGGVPANVSLYCSASIYLPPQTPSLWCPVADPLKGQIQPWSLQTSQQAHTCSSESGTLYTGLAPMCVLSGPDYLALKNRAKALNTYYNGVCPSGAAQYAGKLVYIDNVNACLLSGLGTLNSASNPGMIVLGMTTGMNAGMTVYNGTTYYGLILGANEQLVTNKNFIGIGGTGKVVGGVIVEGGANIGISSTVSPALVYDGSVFSLGTVNGPIRIVPGTRREVPPHS